jgi:hypothetical protein
MTASEALGVNGDLDRENHRTLIHTALRGGTQTHELWLPKKTTVSEMQIVINELHKLIATELVDHPAHYNAHPSGVEAIRFLEYMSFNSGNAAKYIYRHLEKGSPVPDLRKARWYIERELERMRGERNVIPDEVLEKLTAHKDDPIVRAVLLLIHGDLREAKRAAADAERALL